MKALLLVVLTACTLGLAASTAWSGPNGTSSEEINYNWRLSDHMR